MCIQNSCYVFWNWEKFKTIDRESLTLGWKNMDSSTTLSEASEHVFLFAFILSLVSLAVYTFTCIYIYIYFFETVKKIYQKFIKRRSEAHQKSKLREISLNFDQWKTFSKNHELMRVSLLLVYKVNKNNFPNTEGQSLHCILNFLNKLKWRSYTSSGLPITFWGLVVCAF